MTCKQFSERIADYLSGEGGLAERRAMQDHIAACTTCRRELEEVDEMWSRLSILADERPGPDVRRRFYDMLEKQVAHIETAAPQPIAEPRRRYRYLPPHALRLAAALTLFAIGLSAGLWVRRASPAPDHATNTDIGQLRNEVDGLRRTLAVTLLNQESASDRLKGVYLTAAAGNGDDATRSLLNVLNNDPNVNLRLSAIDSLVPLADRPQVRLALFASLGKQTSPLLQVALVNTLLQSPDIDTTRRLQQLAADPQLQPDVRRYLQNALQTSI